MDSLSTQHLDRLRELAEGEAASLGLVILRLTARGTPSRAIIEVILDGPRLITLDDCQTVSKSLNNAIETESLAGGNYRLDVLSPGLDEPLVHDYQFQRTVGHLVEIFFKDEGKDTSVKGILIGFSVGEIIVVKQHKKKGGKSERG